MKIIDGDLLALAKEGHFDVIAHGCNCKSIMGAGIAAQIKEHFPFAYARDKQYYPDDPYKKLGNFSYCTVSGNDSKIWFTIFNLYTQLNPGKDLNYAALELALWKLNAFLKVNYPSQHPPKVGLPQIGCGIAGGDWAIVSKIIEKTLTDCDVTVVNYIPDKSQ